VEEDNRVETGYLGVFLENGGGDEDCHVSEFTTVFGVGYQV